MGFAIAGAVAASGAMSAQGGKAAADAASSAAKASEAVAQKNFNTTARLTKIATQQGMAAFDRDIKNQEKNLSRQEQLISQIDPTIIEASQQALKLLRGDTASSLAPVQNQRAQQRQKLVNSLREQLGPGAETSSAGIKALTAFDSDTNNLLSNQQQSTLSQLSGLATQFNTVRPDMFREIQGLSSFDQGKTQLQFQRAGMLSNARYGLQQAAGGQFIGAQMAGQSQQALGNQLVNAGVTLGSAMMTSDKGTT